MIGSAKPMQKPRIYARRAWMIAWPTGWLKPFFSEAPLLYLFRNTAIFIKKEALVA